MPRLVVENFSPSLDGYGAGPSQDLENPLGLGDGIEVVEAHRFLGSNEQFGKVVVTL